MPLFETQQNKCICTNLSCMFGLQKLIFKVHRSPPHLIFHGSKLCLPKCKFGGMDG